ncbi:PREDICTED: uncharacterized protein LOC106337928 [Brassica oleracea var. oleracea]|uniref:uncharacterized protein LOC106337928 n=1 Tax=Brassica oleracea var. oleracea TaxID=109376 RepID=UPI0006A747CF|nr:PREDICTED: uncharacterized protein LOC106337928 [Brassica oleracea var. oleracea]
MRMKLLLKVHKVWEVVENESDAVDNNDMATALLFQSVSEALILQVGELESAKKVWDAIKAREARLQTLLAEFDRLKMKDNKIIDDFVGKLSEISLKSAALWENMEESKLVKKFLKSLPRKKYIHIVASLEQLLDLKTTSFEDIIGHLKTYEERIREEEGENEDNNQSKLMYANIETQSNCDYHGECDKIGHFAATCPDRLLKLQETQETRKDETQEVDGLMMHKVVYLNEQNVQPKVFESSMDWDRIWYLDNGASNHMTGNKNYFKSIDETITGKVRFGDDSRVNIEGRGSILQEFYLVRHTNRRKEATI